jgi:hypothetical protein
VVVKKTLRTMMLATVGVLGSVAVASAQPAPAPGDPAAQPAPPAPPPPAPPAPAQPAPGQPAPEFGVAPAALPAAPTSNAPVPSVAWGNQPAPTTDTTTPAETPKPKKANPLLLTRLDWTNTASASIFGIGKDQIGSDGQNYTMDFQFRARYSPIADSTKRLYVQAVVGWGAELTNSDSTTMRNEWLFRDMSVGTGYQHRVYKNDKGVSFTPLIAANYILPTSKASLGSGRYGTLSLTGGFMTGLPLVPKSDWLSDIFIIAIAGYSHLFSKYTTPTNPTVGVQRPRQLASFLGKDAAGASVDVASDQTSGTYFVANSARFLVAMYPTIYKDLNLNLSFDLTLPFRYQGSAATVNTPTGPVQIDASTTRLNPQTTFDIGFSYTLFNMTRIDVGYQNQTSQLAENGGKRVSLFYGVDASFYTNVSVFIDSILDHTLHLTGGPTAKRAAKNGFANGTNF